MVSTKLMGGLGNQLFMMAAAIGYSIKHNMSYQIPMQVENPHYEGQKPYIFPGVTYTNPAELSPDLPVYKEPFYHYQEIPFQQNILLDGYWQSEKYFSHCRPEILKAFGFEYKFNAGVVAIHVRRGDYLKLPDYHPTVTMEYIINGINYFRQYGYEKFKVFSDGMDWCKENINSTRFVGCKFEYSDGKSEIEDLVAASHCQHIIGSNSTFSWWAHYLNQYPQKWATFPVTWFGRFLHTHDTKDLYPATCTKF